MNKVRKSDQEQEREKKRFYLIDKFPDTYNKPVPNAISIKEFKEIKEQGTIFGRVMARRDMGKSLFIDLMDNQESIQLYVNLKKIDAASIENIKLLDLGDFVAVTGTYMLTKTKEVSIRTEKFWIVTKALLPLPNKLTKLKDEEELVRKRYLDLLMNKEKQKLFVMRTKGMETIRSFFKERGYLEVETPHLHTLSTGAIAKPFQTHHNALGIDMYLRIAPELFLKRLVAGNMGKVFEIAHCYRNEGISYKHNPEFDLVEAYLPNACALDVAKVVEELIKKVAFTFWGGLIGKIENKEYNFQQTFPKITMNELVKEKYGIDLLGVSLAEAKQFAKKHIDLTLLKRVTNAGIMYQIYEALIEKTLMGPVFVFNPPAEVSPLAKRNEADPRVANRFELIINGIEIGNGYDEQNDALFQEEAFLEQAELKKAGNIEVGDFDHEYLTMLKHGLPPTGGLGIGLDRLFLLFLNLKSIKDIILFPPVKTKNI